MNRGARPIGDDEVTIRVGAWDRLAADAAPVRKAVFVEEQGIAIDDEWDEMDTLSVHCVAYRAGHPVGTGRLLPDARIGRMAVLASARGEGVGAAILEALITHARDRGERRLLLHAQRPAVGFYAKRGFEAVGEPFDEVGIEHLTMQLAL